MLQEQLSLVTRERDLAQTKVRVCGAQQSSSTPDTYRAGMRTYLRSVLMINGVSSSGLNGTEFINCPTYPLFSCFDFYTKIYNYNNNYANMIDSNNFTFFLH